MGATLALDLMGGLGTGLWKLVGKVVEEEKDIIKVKEDKVGARTGLTIITEEQTRGQDSHQDSHQHSPQHSPQASLQARQQASVLEMSCRHVLMCAPGSLPGCLERV